MKIKVTPLDWRHDQLEGIIHVHRFCYFAKFHSAGLVTEIKANDNWLDDETAWVSKTELPFITAIRHAQLGSEPLINQGLTPIIHRYQPLFETLEVEEFPTRDQCMELVYKYCDYSTDGIYHFYNRDIKESKIKELVEAFDCNNDLIVRASACLYKAYILLNASWTFAEEVYVNAFISFEAIIEDLILCHGFTGADSRNMAIDIIDKYLMKDNPGIDFADYEEEMRDGIRNNIIHPFRRHSKKPVAKPVITADDIFEDLSFIDWLFKKVIEGKLK